MALFERYHKIKDAAEILKVTSPTLHRWIKNGKVRVTKLPSGQYRISDEELARILRTAGEKDGK